ncbi:MAG: hypothetical protein FWE38_02850 [Firmicutes bacterium]|nr:hypothetical protein [Bacillota bacterium]
MRKFLVFAFLMVVVVGAGFYYYMETQYPTDIRMTSDEFKQSTKHGVFTIQPNYTAMVDEDDERYITLKLFGVIPVRRMRVELLPFDRVYAGGHLVGFFADVDGLIVTRDHSKDLRMGDVILVDSIAEWEKLVNNATDNIEFQIMRNGNTKRVKIPVTEPLGLLLKSESTGIGTVTYINPENKNFATLGHRLNDFETGASFDVRGGTIHTSNIIGIERSESGTVGKFRSVIKREYGAQGEISSSNMAGVFGCLYAQSGFLRDTDEMGVGSRFFTKPGRATLRTTIDELGPQDFDIEIIKTRFQRKASQKSMIVRITDQRLLDATGGIIHGMSGSPIIQDGKIVGALTHVTLEDVTKGYGIYLDFILP